MLEKLGMVMMLEEPEALEGRHEPYRALGGVAEIAVSHANKYIIAQAAELSLSGCFVRTCESMPVGTRVNLKITYNGSGFNTHGEVAYGLSEKGMGIRFVLVAPKDEALLEEWLR